MSEDSKRLAGIRSKRHKEKLESIQAYINPETEPELYAAYQAILAHHGGSQKGAKKRALAAAIMAEHSRITGQILKEK
jgi:hypothetical protein